MPTEQEIQVVHVEMALRQRFFPLVPKVEKPQRQGWNEETHDVDRLSRALAAYCLVGLSEVDDVAAAGALTDGDDDFGIDAFLFDKARNRLVIVQSKYKRTGTAPSQEEVQKTINGIRALQDRRFQEFNAHFQNRLDEIEEALDSPGVVFEVIVVFLGETLGPHATTDLDALQTQMNRLSQRMLWKKCGISTVFGWLVEEEAPPIASVDVFLENWAHITTPRKAIYGQISAADLAELVEDKGKALFERNIRHYLGSVGVNAAIEETVRRRPGDLFYLNNGLTAVAESIVPGGGNSDRNNFRLEKVSIVNGAQPAGSIATAAMEGDISLDAKLMITVIEIGTANDDFGRRVTQARNLQTAARGIDFAALDPNQERIRQELAVTGITYHYRPSADARVRRDDSFTVEEAALALACLSQPILSSVEVQTRESRRQPHLHAIDLVVAAKKEVSRLWDQNSEYYKLIFGSNVTSLRICRLVRIHRLLDQILADSERSETVYHRRMFFRHGRYFTMAFVAHRLKDVLTRVDLQLTDADKTSLSQQTNLIAEAILTDSAQLQGVKGYLAIFRNLTDAQQLADGVLRRLVEQDRHQRDGSRAPQVNDSPTTQTPATN